MLSGSALLSGSGPVLPAIVAVLSESNLLAVGAVAVDVAEVAAGAVEVGVTEVAVGAVAAGVESGFAASTADV